MASAGYRNSSPRLAPRFDRILSSGVGTRASPSPLPPASQVARAKSFSPSSSSSSSSRRSSTGSQKNAKENEAEVLGRVRVAIRLRPRNAEEVVADADFADCVELQPELKRLKLRKNNWDSETYQFDEILTEFASQKRVYEAVAKPVIESVLEGYNGTVMAYGQTGTGKTYTLGSLGQEDPSDRGIMVRAMEEVLAGISPEHDSVTVSYLQLYMESVQDLLEPENDNIPIVEDPKTGDISLPGATLVEIWDQKNFEELLRVGEANRFAANTKLNTESSRSHAILMVHVRKVVAVPEKDVLGGQENRDVLRSAKEIYAPRIRKSKLIVVDLAGSERINKSGSEGHTLEEAKSINLSLTALGKCINALTERSPHVPTRDSKLTRLLRDSFGGSARTSLVITIGPSPRHRGETSSTIMFAQRAMKVENMVKLKEEFDYKSLCRSLEIELEKFISENERLSKSLLDAEEMMGRQLETAKANRIDAETKLKRTLDQMEAEKSRYQKELSEMAQKLAMELAERERIEEELKQKPGRKGSERSIALDDVVGLKLRVETERQLREQAQMELRQFKPSDEKVHTTTTQNEDMLLLNHRLEEEIGQCAKLKDEVKSLQTQLLQLSPETTETKRTLQRSSSGRVSFNSDSLMNAQKSNQQATIAKLFDQVGLQKILSLLASEDVDVRIHAVKVVANLAAEESNQEKIVEFGGLSSLLMLLQSSEDETIRRVAAGAIANLAMNEANQELIMSQGGLWLLARTADDAEDPQTLRMVAGAIANLCANQKLQFNLREEGGIKALLRMARSRHVDVVAQVARGIANFAKSESRLASLGLRRGRSVLMEDGALTWIVANVNNEDSSIRRHVELAICHLAQHESNAKDLVATGALWELLRISKECSREDIRSLAQRTLAANSVFQSELANI